MARTDTLQHFLTDVANSIRNKTGGSSPIEADHFDTEIESISGGGYDGQLPNNSSINKILCVGSELRVYLRVDGSASGTRVYYKENAQPDLTDSYIDVPRNSSYGVISGVNINSMYGVRVAAYIIYDDNQKAFNNSMSIGCTAFKLTTQYNSSGAVLLDLPAEVQGNSATFTTYSKYTNTFYIGIASKLYKVDCTSANPQFERIGTDQTFSSAMRMTPTDQGVFIQGSSYWLLYDETTGTFTSTGLTTNGYVEVLSNEDIFGNDGQYGGGTLKKFNKTNKNWENFNGNNRGSDSWYVDNGGDIYITTKYSSNQGFKLYKYNPSTTSYDYIGYNTNAGNTRSLWGVKEYIGTTLIQYNRVLYYLKNGVFKEFGLASSGDSFRDYFSGESLRYRCDNFIAQDPNNINMFYFAHYNGYYAYTGYIYKYDMNTEELTTLHTCNDSSSSYVQSLLIYFDNKIITYRGIYDTTTDTWTTKGIGAASYTNSLIVKNNKLYSIGNTIYKYDTTTDNFVSIQAICSGGTIYYIENGNKLYLYDSSGSTNTVCGLRVLDTTNDTITQISSNKYTAAVIKGDKVYFRSAVATDKQLILDLTDDTYELSDYGCGTGFSISSTKEGGLAPCASSPDTTCYKADQQFIETMYDSTNKIIYGLDKQLLDLSSSTKTYTLRSVNWYMYNYIYSGACYQSNDYSELVILFTQQNNS